MKPSECNGLSRRPPDALVSIDAVEGPVTFRHELADTPAPHRFSLPNGEDFVLAQGYRAVIEYDVWDARNKILLVMPIPLAELS